MRVPLQPLLKLPHTLRELRELGVLRLKSRRQRQQYLDHRLAALCVDRLRLRALHARSFAAPARDPADSPALLRANAPKTAPHSAAQASAGTERLPETFSLQGLLGFVNLS